MKDKQTPLVKQYSQIKQKHPDAVLLYRMGDFFETFDEDAEITSKVCGIVLTKRNNGAGGDTPLAGFPHHQLENYLPKLVKAGYRVAVCEQVEDPKKARGIVKREVIEVITPGVALYDKLLDTKRNNYLAAIYLTNLTKSQRLVGLSFTDISTAEFSTGEFNLTQLCEILETLSPSEIIISKQQKNEILPLLEKLSFKPAITKLEPWIFDEEFGRQGLLGQFKTQSLKPYGIEELPVAIASAGAVLHYINETQFNKIEQIKSIKLFNPSEFMILDYATRRNLEITFSAGDVNQQGTLISILDSTITPQGGRLFKQWITRPLIKLSSILKRKEVVKIFFVNAKEREKLRELLGNIADLERIISKICSMRAHPRDMITLKNSLVVMPEIAKILNKYDNFLIQYISKKISEPLKCASIIEKSLNEELGTSIGSGNVFRRGYSSELDSYLEAKHSGKSWITNFQENERKTSGIPSLKVSFNNVFGYYIEISNTHKGKVPKTYERRQTLTNAERYTTPELKSIESKILSAEEKISELEQSLFTELQVKVSMETAVIQDIAKSIAALDCLLSFAEISQIYNYCEPVVDDSNILEIEEGRHPVVERLLQIGEKFTPNSTYLEPEKETIHIITGPNMSGKSCYLRQVGLIVLLAQIGCYVPAKSARVGIVDRIFTRVGAQDNITAGESTFLVEMQEAANIMNNASNKSLILLDEVGRGTATFDGISIAWAIAEYINNNIDAKTLFATHYHELNDLAEKYESIANYCVEVLELDKNILFTHKVKAGASNHSFGIHVAKMSGLPLSIINRADEILKSLEGTYQGEIKTESIKTKKASTKQVEPKKKQYMPEQLPFYEFRDDAIRDKIRNMDIDNLSPVQALLELSELHKEIKNG